MEATPLEIFFYFFYTNFEYTPKMTNLFWIIKVVEGLPKLLRVFREGLA